MSEFLIATLMAVGAIFVGAGFTVASVAADNSGFVASRICFFIGAILLAAPISNWLGAAKFNVVVRAVGLGVIGAATFVALFLAVIWVNALEVKNTPKLFAGDIPDPTHSACPDVPAGALKIFLGSNLAWSTTFPHTVLRMGNNDMIVLDQDKKGALILKTLRIFDAANTLIARFDDGEIWNSGEIRAKKPDKSTIIVYDKQDTEVMRVVFLNPTSLQVTGTFFRSPFGPVVITDAQLSLGGITMTGSCFGGNGTDIAVG